MRQYILERMLLNIPVATRMIQAGRRSGERAVVAMLSCPDVTE
jgi:hypothetical protein